MYVHYNRGLPCVPRTATLKSGPGLLSSRAVRRCILSFSASSSRVCIQPWSRVMRRRDFKWRTIAPIIPGDVWESHQYTECDVHMIKITLQESEKNNSNESEPVIIDCFTTSTTHESDRTHDPYLALQPQSRDR